MNFRQELKSSPVSVRDQCCLIRFFFQGGVKAIILVRVIELEFPSPNLVQAQFTFVFPQSKLMTLTL